MELGMIGVIKQEPAVPEVSGSQPGSGVDKQLVDSRVITGDATDRVSPGDFAFLVAHNRLPEGGPANSKPDEALGLSAHGQPVVYALRVLTPTKDD